MGDTTSNNLVNGHFLHQILNPKSVCVFGANNDLLRTMGSMQFRNIISGGFKGNLYPIHPKLEMVQGYKAYKSVLELPETPDLAFLILPPKAVPKVMEECGKKGIKYMIITSGGFREKGENGIELSNQIDDIAKKNGIRFIGPNCLGVYNGWYDAPNKDTYFNTLWVPEIHERGSISLASQSGTIACHTVWHEKNIGVKIGKSISNGNERNIDIVDFLEYFREDPETEVIGLYIEEIKRGKEFIQVVREITPKKPIVAIYAGGSEAAARSILSHTGSMGGNQRIYDAVFKETGIISTDYIMDFLYYLRTFSWAQKTDIFPKGNRVGVITDSGGAGTMMTKTLEKYGLKVPEFSKELQENLHQYIPPTAGARNPIDVTFDVDFYNLYIRFPRIIAKSGEVDSIIIYGVYDFGELVDYIDQIGLLKDSNLKDINSSIEIMFINPIKRLIKRLGIPIFYVGPQPYTTTINQVFLKAELPVFDFWDFPTDCLRILTQYSEFRKKYSCLNSFF